MTWKVSWRSTRHPVALLICATTSKSTPKKNGCLAKDRLKWLVGVSHNITSDDVLQGDKEILGGLHGDIDAG